MAPSTDNKTVEDIIKEIPVLINQISELRNKINEQNKSTDKASNESQDTTTNNHDNNVDGARNQDDDDNYANTTCWRSFAVREGQKANVSSTQKRSIISSDNSQKEGRPTDNLERKLGKLEKDLDFIMHEFKKLKKQEVGLGEQFLDLASNVTSVANTSEPLPHDHENLDANIRSLNKKVLKLKLHIPLPPKASKDNALTRGGKAGDDNNSQNKSDDKSNDSIDFKEMFQSLNAIESKLCLMCFALFPENVIVKKKLMFYLWVGEGFVEEKEQGDHPKITAEEVTENILKDFMNKGFIKPEIKKRKLIGFVMDTSIRQAVIDQAREMLFLDFDEARNHTAEFKSCRACLVRTKKGYSRTELMDNDTPLGTEKSIPPPKKKDPEKLHALLNINDPYPDFKPGWFSRMINLNILYLGNWQSTAKHHIEVEGTEYSMGFKNMKYLKLLSLQGVSRVKELPDTVSKLTQLRILDLNACHNLVSLPNSIGELKMLTHLDLSQCYLLDQLPEEIGSLSALQVLKGFVIPESEEKKPCTIHHLTKLKELRKLSIYTNRKKFPYEKELCYLNSLNLIKLTIAWTGKSLKDDSEDSSERKRDQQSAPEPSRLAAIRRGLSLTKNDDHLTSRPAELPSTLQKLDLRCYPETVAPPWMDPIKLMELQKLYIRGGNLLNLDRFEGSRKWTVKILRLKFLRDLRMEWRDLENIFPEMIYIDKVNCPKLTFFPCNMRGVWVNEANLANHKHELTKLGLAWSFVDRTPTD